MEKIAQVSIGEKFGSPLGQEVTVGDLTSIIVSNAIMLAGIIMLFLLVFGGISIIMAAGQDDPEQMAKGKKATTSAVIGFIIVVASYWIVRIIELLTGANIFNPGI